MFDIADWLSVCFSSDEDILCFFKAVVDKEKVLEIILILKRCKKAVFGWLGKLTGKKTRTDKDLRADGY